MDGEEHDENLLDGEEEEGEGVDQEISTEDMERLLADGDEGMDGGEEEEGGEGELCTEEGGEEGQEESDPQTKVEEKMEEDGTNNAEKKAPAGKPDTRGRGRGRPPPYPLFRHPIRFPFGPRGPHPPGMRGMPPFRFRGPPGMPHPGYRGHPGFRGRGPPPRMGHPFPPRPPPPGFCPPFMRGRPGMRPPMGHHPPPFPREWDGGWDEWENHEERGRGRGGDQRNKKSRGAKNQIQTVIAGSDNNTVNNGGRKRPSNMGYSEHPPKRQMTNNSRQPVRGGYGQPPPQIKQNNVQRVQQGRVLVGGDAGFSMGQCHSNLRTIQCVDAPPPLQVSRGPKQIIHNPSPTLTSVPIQMDCDSSPRVLVQNLPSSVNFDRISQMANKCGTVVAIQINSEQKSAVVEFRESGSADLFSRSHNRKMMDLAIITATRLM